MHTTTPAPHTPTPPATAKHNNTPRLRFAEFQEAVPTHPLSGIAEIVNEKIRVEAISSSSYVSTENLLPEFAGMAATGNLPPVISVTRFQPKDILISNIRPYLKKVWQADIHGGASNDVLVVRAKSHVDANYLAALLRSDHFIDYVMRGAKGVKMPRGEISMIREFPIPCPSDAEQQKIAACLTSLDTLITAQTQKLDTLKTHKKGLMQQLFPRAGETTPRLRFAEFQEAGEWETSFEDAIFSQISNKEHNSDLPVLAITQEHGARPRDMIDYHVSVTDKSIESYKVVEVGDFIISLRSFQGGIEFSKYRGICSPAYVILRLTEAHSQDYFRHYLKTERFIAQMTKNLEGLRDGKMISFKQFSELELPIPQPAEQQKIAACLSSLDELITAQAQKVTALQTHKKGLMQQLFPAQAKASA